jgi:hypothetical protein
MLGGQWRCGDARTSRCSSFPTSQTSRRVKSPTGENDSMVDLQRRIGQKSHSKLDLGITDNNPRSIAFVFLSPRFELSKVSNSQREKLSTSLLNRKFSMIPLR